MTDRISKEHRSWNMSRIRSKGTEPERRVRSTLHRMGYRFRLHRKELAGIPDIVLKKYRTVIFVNGCFWHRHKGCKFAYTPKSRIDFWQQKFNENIHRDREVLKDLTNLDWRVLTIWECQTENPEDLKSRLIRLMKPE